jgi:beta propeller repeat protein
MPLNKKNSPHPHHTVILKPRGMSASKSKNNGLKQEYLHTSNISPPRSISPKPPDVYIEDIKRPQKHTQSYNHEKPREYDLLARFGIDSVPGRMVTRILITFLLFQPVYVAMGMEIENETYVVPVSEDAAVEKTNDTEETQEENTIEAAPEDIATLDTEEGDVDSDVDSDVEDGMSSQVHSENLEEIAGIDEVDETTQSTAEIETQYGGGDEETTGEDTENNNNSTGTGEEETNEDSLLDENNDAQEEATSTEESTSSGGGGSSQSDDSDDTSNDAEDNNTTTSATTTASTTPETTATTTDSETETATSSDSETIATTSPETDELETNISQNPTSKYIFGEGDCTLVSDGEFYCVAEGPERQQMTGDPRVYAQKDREGDKEIYYFDGIEVKRITNNSYDDFAPVFDEETRRIVWQSMIQDRLQIMMHELPTNITRQVTTSRQNSSNPSISGDIVVWQEWVDTNWEIMMTDVDNNGQEFEIERLTDNAIHDMFPAAYDGLLTWQSERGSSWEVIVYDMHTGKQHALEKDEDTKYENPRFVLLFDSKHENGDVETIGYDLDTGEMMELGTKTNRIPSDPVTPKDETPEALYREATSTPQIKVEGDDDTDSSDDSVDL